MSNINDDNDSDAVADEKYEISILNPLRRRLSDVASTTDTRTNRSPSSQNCTTSSNCTSENCKENEYNYKTMPQTPPSTPHRLKDSQLYDDTNATPNIPEKIEQKTILKSCLSARTTNKRFRSSLTSPAKSGSTLSKNENFNNTTPTLSPTIEPSKKRQKLNVCCSPTQNITQQKQYDVAKQIPHTSRKVVQFAPSSAVEYEQEVPVNQSLTPIPSETAVRRYPTEMKLLSNEELELKEITKQNHAILKEFDDMFDADDINDKIRRRRQGKKNRIGNNRRKSFYITSTSARTNDLPFHTPSTI